MNMTNVLHRRSKPDVAASPPQPAHISAPPARHPPGIGDDRPASSPIGVKVLVAILIVATVVGAVGITAALTSSNDGSVERQLQDRLTAITHERDDALDAVDQLDTELANLRQQLRAAQAGNADLTDRIGELETTIDAREASLQAANQRAVAAIGERDALAKLFPIEFDASLVDVGLVGDHDVRLAQVHCTGLASCGTAPAIDELTISRTPEGWLWMAIPGFVEGGLSRAGGALHMIAHSTTAIPKCAGVARQAEITMTLFPGSFGIAADGARDVVGVGAVLTVEAPTIGACPAVLAFYSADLTPQA
jgi:hypothetical protein